MLKPVRPIILTASVLMAVAWPGRAEAQYFRLAISEINLWGPQDSTESTCPTSQWPSVCVGWDRRDEVYFTVAGVTGQNAAISLPYIPLPPHGSPYGMRSPQDGGPSTFRNIPLWDGHWQSMAAGQFAFFVVFVRERDSEPLTLASDVQNAANQMRQVRVGTQLSQDAAVGQLESIARRLFENLSSDTDDVIAALTVHIRIPTLNPAVMATWKPLDTTASPFAQSSWSAKFYRSHNCCFIGWGYETMMNIQQLISPVVNRNSGKCLDVVNADLRGGANVQQYACSGRYPGYYSYYDATPNQQWILNPWFPDVDNAFSLISVNSGLCLDVAGGSVDDGANVQQYACQRLGFDSHQQWRFNPTYSPTPPYATGLEMRNVKSDKCLDVADASLVDGGNVQQFTCHRGTNQLWLPYGYLPFRR
jgi:hypothetical protein